jgi:hypothetical protein
MLVKNNHTGLAGINIGTAVPCAMLTLKSGWNDVPLAEWLEARKTCMSSIDAGIYEEMIKEEKSETEFELDAEGKEVPKRIYYEVPLNKLAPVKAASIVESCWDKDSLKKWQGIEGRDEVRLRITRQLEKLTKPKGDSEA